MKKLIVTADDVGIHRGMTDGALEAHRRGIVSACSLVACGRDFERAVGLLRGCLTLSVGAHLTLVEEEPVLPASSIPTLTRGGRFHRDFRRFFLLYAAGRIDGREIECELRAQIDRIVAAGIRVDHLNGHQHLHLLPAIFRIVMRLAEEFEVPFVRVASDAGGTRRMAIRSLEVSVLNGFGRFARSRFAPPLLTTEATIGIEGAGHLTVRRIEVLLARISTTAELVVHPGVDNEDISRVYDWGYDWERELEALCDPSLREMIRREAIELASPRSLALSAAGPRI
ncbi:MAG TPA: ChbG/HpnK family deacetylase [Thermoanaerobaculia bacterium]|nr:ChbG/HpnK family deacetylase [Thermoanaerobaculia bacterium]